MKLATVKTDDSTTLIRMAKEGYINEVKLTFSWRFMTWVYHITTTL